MATAVQKILPYGDFESPILGVWMVTGMCNFPLRRNMTVWKLPDDTLLVHSPIAMEDADMAKLDALGRLAIILVPHGGHRMDLAFYKRRYPKARVVAPSGAKTKVEEVIPVEGIAEDDLRPHGITVHPLPGWKHGELGYEIPLPNGGKALVLCDVLGNSDPAPGIGGWLMSKLTAGVKAPLGVPRIVKRMLLADRAAAARGLARLAEIPDLRFVSVAHGRPVSANCAATLREAAAAL